MPSTSAVTELLAGLRVGGRLTIIGIDGSCLAVPADQLVMNRQTVGGQLTGSPRDIDETMRFAAINEIHASNGCRSPPPTKPSRASASADYVSGTFSIPPCEEATA